MFNEIANDRIVTSHELAKELEAQESSVFKGKTGFPTLDRILDGVEEGELIIVTGPTGEGKSSLLMSITTNMIKAGVQSCWFTLEITPRQFIQKMVKAATELPMFYLPRKGFDDADNEYVKRFELKEKRRFQMIDWLDYKIREAQVKANGELKAVFIDHIHQIFSLERVERNISLELGDMVAKIKQMAIEYGLVVFLIAHTKDDPQQSNREPRKEDIRDSGLISRLADTIIGVWRVSNEAKESDVRRTVLSEGDLKGKVRIFKNRRTGEVGTFLVEHKNHRLYEPTANEEF